MDSNTLKARTQLVKQETNYKYDGNGNLTNIFDGNVLLGDSIGKKFEYNARDLKKSDYDKKETLKDTPKVETTYYYSDGSVDYEIDKSGVKKVYGYDTLNRNTLVQSCEKDKVTGKFNQVKEGNGDEITKTYRC